MKKRVQKLINVAVFKLVALIIFWAAMTGIVFPFMNKQPSFLVLGTEVVLWALSIFMTARVVFSLFSKVTK